ESPMTPALHPLPRGLTGYAEALFPAGRVLEERIEPDSEREWQAWFYQGDLGARWPSTDGREVELLDPGFWNREPGPDFTAATIRVDGTALLHGDIELDPHALDWERHGHATNPAFSKVVLHVFSQPAARTFFTRTSEHRNVLQVALSGPPRPSRNPDQGAVNRKTALRLLEVAVRFRFHEKSRRLRQAVRLHGWPPALDQALARSLGYKRNSLPFLLLAQRCRWDHPHRESAEARLFGTAGFLAAEQFETAPAGARAYLRKLWDQWWALREEGSRLILPADAWNLAGIRPANHPHRRLGALIAARRRLPEWSEAFRQRNLGRLAGVLGGLEHPFWQTHWNLRGAPLAGRTTAALLGRERLGDFLINAYFPWSLSEDPDGWSAFLKERAPAIPAQIRPLAAWLSPELEPADRRFAWIQQGLLQMAADLRGWKSPRELAEALNF
ncbi:MAG TPA: DUF2851 family protein, partial [Chthoniobacterales bacterium]